jgi:hypothetical protein
MLRGDGTEDSVGGTTTDAVGTAALPTKSMRIGAEREPQLKVNIRLLRWGF